MSLVFAAVFSLSLRITAKLFVGQIACEQTFLDFEQRCGLHLHPSPPTQEGVLVWSGWKKTRSHKYTMNPEKQRMGRTDRGLSGAPSEKFNSHMIVKSRMITYAAGELWAPTGHGAEAGCRSLQMNGGLSESQTVFVSTSTFKSNHCVLTVLVNSSRSFEEQGIIWWFVVLDFVNKTGVSASSLFACVSSFPRDK